MLYNVLPKMKLLVGIEEADTTKDVLLQVLIDDIVSYLCGVTNMTADELPEPLVRNLAIVSYNNLGSEGLTAESYSGISQNFINGLPEKFKAEIKSLRKVKF